MSQLPPLQYLGIIVVFVLAALGLLLVLSFALAGTGKKTSGKEPQPEPKPKTGKLLYREIIVGTQGMADSYIAEIRDYGNLDTRLQIYDVNRALVMEAPACKCYAFWQMVARHEKEAEKKMQNLMRSN